jgi:hypothetical protein
MTIIRAELNSTEQKVYDVVLPHLDKIGSIVVLKQQGDRIRLDVISPHHFQRTAAALEEISGEAASATAHSIDVNLTTHWPVD